MRAISGFLATSLITLIAVPAFAGDLTITGTGRVSATPDIATVSTGVVTHSATAREALDGNTKAMADLIAVLKEAGLEPRDIQTSNFSVTPDYVYSDQRDENGFTKAPQIAGYQVSNSVSIVVRDLEKLGSVLDQAVTVGANQINSVSFSVADTTAIYEQAREAAVADALAKANTYAKAANITLSSIDSITEVGAPSTSPIMYRAAAAPMAGDSVPVQSGELDFTINTQISWDIKG